LGIAAMEHIPVQYINEPLGENMRLPHKGFFFRKTQEQTQWGGTNNLDKSPRLHCDVTGMMVSKG